LSRESLSGKTGRFPRKANAEVRDWFFGLMLRDEEQHIALPLVMWFRHLAGSPVHKHKRGYSVPSVLDLRLSKKTHRFLLRVVRRRKK